MISTCTVSREQKQLINGCFLQRTTGLKDFYASFAKESSNPQAKSWHVLVELLGI